MNNSLVVTNVIKKVKQGGGKEMTGGRDGGNAYRVKGSPAPFMATSVQTGRWLHLCTVSPVYCGP